MKILASTISSISDLKANPMQTIAEGNGETVAILNHNKPAFYCVPVAAYEKMQQQIMKTPKAWDNEELDSELHKRIKDCQAGNILSFPSGLSPIRDKLVKQL